MATTLSSQIYASKDQTVNQITEYLRSYLELENISLVKGSFLSFLVETLAVLSSNLVFYESSVYNEFFLTKAKLAESIYNLSSFLGYNTTEATYAQANVLITVPLTFTNDDITFSIAEDFKFKAQLIPFVTYYSTSIRVQNNNQVSITATDGNKIYDIFTIVDSTGAEPQFRFILPIRQYENVIQEFQIDEDLQTFQFTHIDVPLTGKVSTMTVEIKDPGGASYRTYTEFNSTYLMASDDYGYVSRRTDSGRRLYFGNGLIGVQPLPGSTVRVTVQETQGTDGNVIAGSINTGQRLYAVDDGVTKNVNYTVVNTSPATNGTDEESLEEIRQNAIDNLTSLSRLVTENDYVNADIVMPNSPITSSSKPVLKRSDVRVNEVQLYVNLLYGDGIVHMRNAYTTYDINTTYVPRGSTIKVDNEDYYTLFDLSIDTTANNAAYYDYIMNVISQVPVLVRSYDPPINEQPYVIPLGNLVVTRVGNGATFEMAYTTSESDYSGATCQMQILSTGTTYDMTNSIDVQKFILSFSDYTDIPSDEQIYYFTTKDPDGNQVARYSNTFTFRESLNSFMLSNISTDGTSVTVFDIPVIKSSYYDSTSFVQADFEMQVLQSILTNMDFVNYRMLTDFVNLKFTNTTGAMRNMIYNKVTKPEVTDISSLPNDTTVGERYIVSECDTTYGETKKNQIAQSTHVNRVWATTTTMPLALSFHGSFRGGAISFCGGSTGAYLDNTYKWNGVTWDEIASNPVSGTYRSGAGTTDAGLSSGGSNITGTLDNCELWNGTAWATTSTLTAPRSEMTSFGSTSDALGCGGSNDVDTTGVLTVEIWNGTTWATTTSLPSVNRLPGGVGTTTEGMVFGGITAVYQASDLSQRWNGTTWATTGSLTIPRFSMGDCGTFSDALAAGGGTYSGGTYSGTTSTDIWDGSTWATTNSLNLQRIYIRAEGTTSSAISFGGRMDGSNDTNATEVWTGLTTWSFTVPTSNDIVNVTDKRYRYIYTGKNWVLPIYDIPLQISLEVFKEETYTGSNVDLAALVRLTLISTFSSRFGSNVEIYRSEIIKAVQEIDGVFYCVLISPESDIYFNFDLEDLTSDNFPSYSVDPLLMYGPEYVYFTDESITVSIL